MRFDKRDRESLVKQEAIDLYQENCYMIGRVFSNEPLTPHTLQDSDTIATDEMLKESAEDLCMKDLAQIRAELL